MNPSSYETGDDQHVGRALVKDFDGHPYLGQVVGWAPGSPRRWAVVYCDGDREDLHAEDELVACARRAEGESTVKQQQQLKRQIELWNAKRQSELKLASARDKRRRSEEVGKYAEDKLDRGKYAQDEPDRATPPTSRRRGRSPSAKRSRVVVEEEDDDEEWSDAGQEEEEEEEEENVPSRRGLAASSRSSTRTGVKDYSEQDPDSDEDDEDSPATVDEQFEEKVGKHVKKVGKHVKAETRDGKGGGLQARLGGKSLGREQGARGDKADEVIKRVVKENAEKVKKLDELRKSGQVLASQGSTA
jgi:hypothetical protein